MKIAVQTEDFDVQAEVAALHASPKVGAVVMFLGTVRDLNEGDEVASMTLEHYPGMTEKGPYGHCGRGKEALGHYGCDRDSSCRRIIRHGSDRFCRRFRRPSRGSI